MTTHLVIADINTLNRLMSSPTITPDYNADVPLGGWLPWQHENGDVWAFRMPMLATPDDLRADFRYWPAGMRVDIMGARDYPLIAACDLLGVDEL